MKRKSNFAAVMNAGKPFVKWAGGKSQLIADIACRLPHNFVSSNEAVYVEPFVGGGAVLFWLLQNYPNIQAAYINDINAKLIATYKTVRNSPEQLLARLEQLQQDYLPMDDDDRKDYYLAMRKEYNSGLQTELDTAAAFIFLNRTCFNGLYRENSKGAFNVPHGRYKSPKICDEATIMADAKLLQKVHISCGDFANTLQYASADSFFYLDPPYKPLSNTSSFNAYSKEAFDDNEQIRLRNFCKAIEDKGAHFLLSNSDVKSNDPENDFFDNLYAEFSVTRVSAARMINANPDKRGRLTELMVSNF